MYTTILIPTDGSEHALEAAEHGIRLANELRADIHLHVLSIAEPHMYFQMYMDTNIDAIDALNLEMQETVNRNIDDLEAIAHEQGLEIVSTIRRGVPHEEILQYATDHDLDLIIMGTHGRTGIDRFLAGSVTEYVIRESEIPVLVV